MRIEKILFLILTIVSGLLVDMPSGFCQAKKPTAMVVPSDIYCIRNGFFKEVEVYGETNRIPDYKRLFQEDSDMRAIITSINGFMSKEEFPLKDLEAELKNLANTRMEEDVVTDQSGQELKQSLLDKVKSTARADIILDIDFEFKRNGPERMLSLNLKGLDAYTNKQIATCPVLGRPSANTSLDIMLLEDNYTRLTEFTSDLQRHFDDLMANGREVILEFRISQGAEADLESEFGDEELSETIEYWLDELCVKARYNLSVATENRLRVEQARIPLYNEKGRALDARRFMRIIEKRLEKPPYNFSCRINTRGLGEAWLILGGN
ncbi:MAG: hypothetical protein H6571_07255 [Lewinellaceae bacterium]|nr:hypothetical protein [Lewinellaceae bacterium]